MVIAGLGGHGHRVADLRKIGGGRGAGDVNVALRIELHGRWNIVAAAAEVAQVEQSVLGPAESAGGIDNGQKNIGLPGIGLVVGAGGGHHVGAAECGRPGH